MKLISKDFRNPDETRNFRANGKLELVTFSEDISIGKGLFEPGWKWSNDVKPIMGGTSCSAEHSGYCISGSMVIKMDNGEQFRIQAGEAFHIPAGHDAWVDGKEPCVLIDVGGYRDYAKKKAA